MATAYTTVEQNSDRNRHFQRGKKALEAGQMHEALAGFRVACRTSPTDGRCLAYRVWTEAQLDPKTVERGLFELREALSSANGSSQVAYFLGLLHLQRNDYDHALRYLTLATVDGEIGKRARIAMKAARAKKERMTQKRKALKMFLSL